MNLEVEAVEIRWEQGRFFAEGGVDVRWEGRRLVATSIDGERLSGELARLHAVHGTLTEAGRIWTFDDAAIEGHTARFVGVAVDMVATCGAPSRPSLTASTIEVGDDGVWTATDLRVDPCACGDDRPLLSMVARSARVVPDRYVVLHGGAVRIFDVPVLPIPLWRLALSPEAFRLHLPEVSYGTPGWALGWEGGARVAGVDVSAGPAWRQDRGFRLLAEAEKAGEGLRGELGWDSAEGKVRGLVAGRGGVAGEGVPLPSNEAGVAGEGVPLPSNEAGVAGEGVPGLGWDVHLASDRAYADDFGATYVARGLGWQDSRVTARYAGLGATAWLPDDGSFGEVLGVRAALPHGGWTALEGAAGSLTVDPRLSAGFTGVGAFGGADRRDGVLMPAPTVLDGLAVYAGARLGVRGLARLGPVHLAGRGEAGGIAGDSGLGDTSVGPAEVGHTRVPWGGAELRAEVPFWSEAGSTRAQWWPGVRFDAAAQGDGWLPGDVYRPFMTLPLLLTSAGAVDGASEDAPPGRALAGPSLRAAITGGGVLTTVDAAWLLGPTSTSPRLEADVDAPLGAGAAQLWTHADVMTQAGEVGWRPEGDGVSPSLGMAHAAAIDGAPDVWLTWAAADLRHGVLRAGLSGAWDLEAAAWSGAGVRVGYDDGCVVGMITADLSPDRALPDLGLQVQLRR